MISDFWNNVQSVLSEEDSDYRMIINSWKNKDYHIALMPAIF